MKAVEFGDIVLLNLPFADSQSFKKTVCPGYADFAVLRETGVIIQS